MRRKSPPSEAPDTTALLQGYTLGLSFPLDVMVSTQNAKRKVEGARIHVFSGLMPDGSFVDVGEGIFVASPEFCFLLMARELELTRLIELGYGLCGMYMQLQENSSSTAGRVLSGKSLRDRSRPTSKKRLSAFLSRMSGVSGKNRAQRALRYVANGSASPMETKLAMLLVLPNMLGGYALPMPELNSEIVPPKSLRQSLSQGSFFCDLYWRKPDVAVEYDSDEHHSGSLAMSKDSIKRNVLALSETYVISVTKRQVYSTVELERVAKLVAKSIGHRLRYKECAKFDLAHQKLRMMLLFPSSTKDI